MDTENNLLKDVCTDILENGASENKITLLENVLFTMMNRVDYEPDTAILMEHLTRLSGEKLSPVIFTSHMYIYNSTMVNYVTQYLNTRNKNSSAITESVDAKLKKDDSNIRRPIEKRINNNKYESGEKTDEK